MSEPHPLRERIQEAWGYNEYYKDKYNSFDEYMVEEVQSGSHREMYEAYKTAALSLKNLALKVYNENN